LSNAAIAEHLFISVRTVEHHVSALMTKRDVDSRTGLVAMRFTLQRAITEGRTRRNH
jgi:DNA-binding NarL/FixJ family response regulator